MSTKAPRSGEVTKEVANTQFLKIDCRTLTTALYDGKQVLSVAKVTAETDTDPKEFREMLEEFRTSATRESVAAAKQVVLIQEAMDLRTEYARKETESWWNKPTEIVYQPLPATVVE